MSRHSIANVAAVIVLVLVSIRLIQLELSVLAGWIIGLVVAMMAVRLIAGFSAKVRLVLPGFVGPALWAATYAFKPTDPLSGLAWGASLVVGASLTASVAFTILAYAIDYLKALWERGSPTTITNLLLFTVGAAGLLAVTITGKIVYFLVNPGAPQMFAQVLDVLVVVLAILSGLGASALLVQTFGRPANKE